MAVAEGFFGGTGFSGSSGLISAAGLLAAAAFAFTDAFGFGFRFAAGLAFEIFAARGTFLAVLFFGDFAAFEVLAPGLVRLELARRESRFRSGGFLWLLHSNGPCNGVARLQLKPGISEAQR